MHELLAVCLMTVDRDSLIRPTSPDTIQHMSSPLGSPNMEQPGVRDAMYTTLDRRYVEHDTFELFCAIMKGAKSSYEWRAEEGPVRCDSSHLIYAKLGAREVQVPPRYRLL
jgi:TBC1 domain family protein 5